MSFEQARERARAALDDARDKVARPCDIQPPADFDDDLVRTMIRLMRRDLHNGVRIDYDEPMQLLQLSARAQALVEVPPADTWLRS